MKKWVCAVFVIFRSQQLPFTLNNKPQKICRGRFLSRMAIFLRRNRGEDDSRCHKELHAGADRRSRESSGLVSAGTSASSANRSAWPRRRTCVRRLPSDVGSRTSGIGGHGGFESGIHSPANGRLQKWGTKRTQQDDTIASP
jgi:hypothetical protein